MLAYALREQFTKVRAFAFIDTCDEVTRFFTPGGDVADALARMSSEASSSGSTGTATTATRSRSSPSSYPDAVGPRTSLLILGDARNNYRATGAADAARGWCSRSRHAYWLNPEPPAYWGSGDSATRGVRRRHRDGRVPQRGAARGVRPAAAPDLSRGRPGSRSEPTLGTWAGGSASWAGRSTPSTTGTCRRQRGGAARFALDEVVFVPTGQPWQKTDREVSPAEDRYLMTVIATATNPRFTVSRVDIDRPGPTYTDRHAARPARGVRRRRAVLHHRRRRARADPRLDAGRRAVRPGALRRRHAGPATSRSTSPSFPAGAVSLLEVPALAISSSDCRARVARGAPGLVPRARRRRAVHRQAPALPRAGVVTTSTHGRSPGRRASSAAAAAAPPGAAHRGAAGRRWRCSRSASRSDLAALATRSRPRRTSRRRGAHPAHRCCSRCRARRRRRTASALLAHDPAERTGAVVLVPPQVLVNVPGTGSLPFGRGARRRARRRAAATRCPTCSASPSTTAGSLDAARARPRWSTSSAASPSTSTCRSCEARSRRPRRRPAAARRRAGATQFLALPRAGEQEQVRLARLQEVLDGAARRPCRDDRRATRGLAAPWAAVGVAARRWPELAALLRRAGAADDERRPAVRHAAGHPDRRRRRRHGVPASTPTRPRRWSTGCSRSPCRRAPAGGNRVLVLNGVGTPGPRRGGAGQAGAGRLRVRRLAQRASLRRDAARRCWSRRPPGGAGARRAGRRRRSALPDAPGRRPRELGTIADVVVVVGADFRP